MLRNKKVLVTGGTGSFAQILIPMLLEQGVSELRIVSRDEKKQYEMQQTIHDRRMRYYMGNICQKETIREAFYEIDYVIHTAAMKQVPICEAFPIRAIETNVQGTENVIQLAIENNITKLLIISTDKAVEPTTVMGMTKSLMEKYVRQTVTRLPYDAPTICITRHGNLLGSRGSVIPLWMNQLRQGEALTITNEEMTRFWTTPEEAATFILYVLQYGEQGDIWVNPSKCATIMDIITALERIYDRKIEYNIVGTRQGEKLHEHLILEIERSNIMKVADYYRIPLQMQERVYAEESTEWVDSRTADRWQIDDLIQELLKLDCINKI